MAAPEKFTTKQLIEDAFELAGLKNPVEVWSSQEQLAQIESARRQLVRIVQSAMNQGAPLYTLRLIELDLTTGSNLVSGLPDDLYSIVGEASAVMGSSGQEVACLPMGRSLWNVLPNKTQVGQPVHYLWDNEARTLQVWQSPSSDWTKLRIQAHIYPSGLNSTAGTVSLPAEVQDWCVLALAARLSVGLPGGISRELGAEALVKYELLIRSSYNQNNSRFRVQWR